MRHDGLHDTTPIPGTVSVDNTAPRRATRGRLLCLVGLIASALALSAQWLAKHYYVFDLFAHFTFHYLLAAAAFLIGFFMPRARVLTAVVLIIAGIGAIAWWPQYISQRPFEIGKPASNERKLRLMTFNTWLSNKDWRAVKDEIRRHKPDIVTLMEFGKEKQRAFNDLKSDYPYSVHCINKHYCHMALMSKFPLYDVNTRIIWRGPAFIRARLGKEFGRIYIFGLHSTRPPHVRSQVVQLRAMGKLLKRLAGRKIVMGDFNSTPFANLLSTFSAQSGLKRITHLPTWPARYGPFPQLAIDHVFLSPGMRRLSSARIGNSAGSDHYPAIVDVAVRLNP